MPNEEILFSEWEIKTYLRIKKQILIDKLLIVFIICIAVVYVLLDWGPIEISNVSLLIFSLAIGLYRLLNITPISSTERACQLLEQTINKDPNSLQLLSKIKAGGA